MKFRCPNCNHAIQVAAEDDFALDKPLEAIECPSCHSRISLSADAQPTVPMPEGQQVAHFTILSQLGEGSYGTVYKAYDEELKRIVALKVPRKDKVDARTEATFLREAQAAAACEHANLVRVYEAGRFDDHYYIAMQYIEGITLSEYLKTHEISSTDAAHLLIKLLAGTQVFHDKGLVHRDLKPGNVMLDGQREPVIADFGLAKMVRRDDITVTQTGEVVGTVHYMSPEQAKAAVDVDRRTDIYALGVILYELLTGERPFKPQSQHTLIYAIINDDPPAPRKLNPKIPRDLETICLKAMEKDPSRRYESASQMADSLQLFLDGKPIPDKPVSRVEKAVKWVRRNQVLSGAMAIAFASLTTAALALGMWDRRPTNSVPVVITTDPPADQIVFEKYDTALRVPDLSGFTATTSSGRPVYLLPGLYKVKSWDGNGKYHEVWRTVPEPSAPEPAELRYLHLYYTQNQGGQIALPGFRLFRDEEIEDDMTTVSGGTFEMGYQGRESLAARHRHPVEDFYVGMAEVSYGRFRQVMDQPIPGTGGEITWLQTFEDQYGARVDLSDDRPVTGYPVDVAILYCELVGCRLPTAAEYEYLATQHGSADFPTAEAASVNAIEHWHELGVDEATADVSPELVRNLYFSVAEYTDTALLHYELLFPSLFPQGKGAAFDPGSRDLLMRLVEVRGAPRSWLRKEANQSDLSDLNVRERIEVERSQSSDAASDGVHYRIGWRPYRTAR